MKRLVSWLSRHRLTPAAAHIEHLRRRLAACDLMMERQQHLLLEQQAALADLKELLQNMKRALLKAQFEAEGWHQIVQQQARQLQFGHAPSTRKEEP